MIIPVDHILDAQSRTISAEGQKSANEPKHDLQSEAVGVVASGVKCGSCLASN